jgi:hypothetical protein
MLGINAALERLRVELRKDDRTPQGDAEFWNAVGAVVDCQTEMLRPAK